MALTQSHYRFGKDDGTEAAHTWHANEDANPAQGVIANDTPFLLRFCVQANATGLTNVDNEFQVRKNGGAYQNITTTSTIVKAVAVGAFANGDNCTKRLSGTGTFETTAAGCTEDGTSGGTANDIVASGNSETECGLQIVGADVAGGDTLDFRLTRDGGTLLDTYSVTPTLTVAASTIVGTFSQTLDDLVLSAAGSVSVNAAFSQTLDDFTLLAEGTAASGQVTGTFDQVLDDLTLAAAGSVGVTAAFAETMGDLTLSATGSVGVTGTFAETLGELVLAATGSVGVTGVFAETLGDLILLAEGTAVGGPITGTFDQVMGDLVLLATGTGPPVTAASGDRWLGGSLSDPTGWIHVGIVFTAS